METAPEHTSEATRTEQFTLRDDSPAPVHRETARSTSVGTEHAVCKGTIVLPDNVPGGRVVGRVSLVWMPEVHHAIVDGWLNLHASRAQASRRK